jgi:hypothetical protein
MLSLIRLFFCFVFRTLGSEVKNSKNGGKFLFLSEIRDPKKTYPGCGSAILLFPLRNLMWEFCFRLLALFAETHSI